MLITAYRCVAVLLFSKIRGHQQLDGACTAMVRMATPPLHVQCSCIYDAVHSLDASQAENRLRLL